MYSFETYDPFHLLRLLCELLHWEEGCRPFLCKFPPSRSTGLLSRPYCLHSDTNLKLSMTLIPVLDGFSMSLLFLILNTPQVRFPFVISTLFSSFFSTVADANETTETFQVRKCKGKEEIILPCIALSVAMSSVMLPCIPPDKVNAFPITI